MRRSENPSLPHVARGEVKQSANRGDSTLVIGCGNRLRGDDGVGLELAACLGKHFGGDATVLAFEGEPISLLNLWTGFERVIIIDAVRSGEAVGTLHRFEVSQKPIPNSLFGRSTHAYGVAEVIELARALNKLPPKLTVYGIEGSSFTLGTDLSDVLSNALPGLMDRILADLSNHRERKQA